MAASGFGFGHYAFGHFPFGHSDYGEDAVIRSFPDTYLVDSSGEENVKLKNYLSTIKKSTNDAKIAIDDLDKQINPDEVRSDILRYLGSTIAVELDDYEPEEFRRSLVSNAIQYYRIKGTRNSYKIRGKISGYDVDVTNIYRLNKDRELINIENHLIGSGNGLSSQSFVGNMPTNPIIPGTVDIKIGGVLEAQDDGAGNFVSIGGSGYVITGTIDYIVGNYTLLITPGVPTSELVRVDFQTAFRDRAIGIGDGLAGQTLVVNLPQYPPKKGTLKVKVAGVTVAEDDGDGLMIPSSGSPYAISGNISYETGVLDITFNPSPPLNDPITVDYNKTFLSELLLFYPDDVYEIPAGSGYWFCTLLPGLVPGGPTETDCDYCLTSYIKVNLTVVKPVASGIPTGSENFFDRLIRKLRDITPIHVRDILYELRMVISVDQSENMAADISYQEENNFIPHPMFARYDVVPADVTSTDAHGMVSGTIELI